MNRVTVIPTSAYIQNDMDVGGGGDPYVHVTVGAQKLKTHIVEKGGKNPIWGDRLTFNNVPSNETIIMRIYDKDFISDDFVGEVRVPVSEVLARGGNYNGNTPFTSTKNAGSLAYQITSVPETGGSIIGGAAASSMPLGYTSSNKQITSTLYTNSPSVMVPTANATSYTIPSVVASPAPPINPPPLSLPAERPVSSSYSFPPPIPAPIPAPVYAPIPQPSYIAPPQGSMVVTAPPPPPMLSTPPPTYYPPPSTFAPPPTSFPQTTTYTSTINKPVASLAPVPPPPAQTTASYVAVPAPTASYVAMGPHVASIAPAVSQSSLGAQQSAAGGFGYGYGIGSGYTGLYGGAPLPGAVVPYNDVNPISPYAAPGGRTGCC